ncbi:MAG: nitroreductase family deazaflavin-dependent oxidoreductase [Gammaproteobacteria bacterium]|nr:nitroreductase family deazaflavin-dependent oxidoreductase [Gammaproteobacteria bacterium]
MKNPIWLAFSRVVSIHPVTLFLLRLATRVDRPLLRATKGRLRLSFVIPVLLLRCRGAQTGIEREVPLLYVPVGDAVLIIGSNGGQIRDPAWCHNLRAQPEVRCLFRGEERRFAARELSGSEHTSAWEDAVGVYPGYVQYQDRVERKIPLFRLDPI